MVILENDDTEEVARAMGILHEDFARVIRERLAEFQASGRFGQYRLDLSAETIAEFERQAVSYENSLYTRVADEIHQLNSQLEYAHWSPDEM